MTKLQRLKPYKNNEPYETVHKIRGILKAHNLFLVEYSGKSTVAGTYCNRIQLGDPEVESLHIGTNGKGMTPRYALASAYGEFMERLQNMCISANFSPESWFYKPEECATRFPEYNAFLDSCSAVSSYLYSPDEKWMSVDELLPSVVNIFQKMRVYKDLPAEEIRKVLNDYSFDGRLVCVPFYSVFEDKQVYLPYKIIKINTGSNGMCAGNSPKEALIQGLAEIYERVAQQKIMQENLTCPDVPLSVFEGTDVYEKLQHLQSNDIEAQVLDLSCGIGLPVVALKLVSKRFGIVIHPGADPSPITALERCLTETYQAIDENKAMLARFKKEPLNPPGPNASEEEIDRFYENLKKCFVDGTGAYPDNVQNAERAPGFKGFEHPVTRSDDDDFQYMLNIAKKTGNNVYIRDNSYLGIPAFYIFIPGMSDLCFFRGPKAKNILDYGRELVTLRSLPTASLDDIKHLKEYIENDIKNTYASVCVADSFPPGIADYLPDGIDKDPDMLLQALAEHIAFLEGKKPEPVFTKENWPICCNCDECAYRNECKHKALIKTINSVRESNLKYHRPQDSRMFQ